MTDVIGMVWEPTLTGVVACPALAAGGFEPSAAFAAVAGAAACGSGFAAGACAHTAAASSRLNNVDILIREIPWLG